MVDVKKLIRSAIERNPDEYEAYHDYFEYIRTLNQEEQREECLWLRERAEQKVVEKVKIEKFFDLAKKTYLLMAPYDFDSYLLYLEWNRPVNERFYQPRRRIMRKVADAMQRLADDKLDELFLSMPPRVGKTTMLMMFCTWLVGRDSEKSNLYAAYSDLITSAFYSGCLEVIEDPVTYLWHDVFPTSQIVSTNSKDETFNVDRKKRYPSLTCRSLYGTLNGACDCSGMLISDDLIGGIEEALNKSRMIAAWSKVDNNLLPRAKETAKILWCGTRWSLIDPAGLRMDLLKSDSRFAERRFEMINLPALDEKDESNFEYAYSVGFSSDYYKQRRASFERNNDMASWMAQYMGEPIERSGSLFEPGDMNYYNGVLPECKPDRVFMAVDPAFGGGDYVSAPVCFQYGETVYIADVVYNDGDKTVTQPEIVHKVQQYGVQAVRVETTKSTSAYAEKIDDMLREAGIRVNIMTKSAPNNKSKEMRIFDRAPEIRNFMFLESGKRSKEYDMFMQNLFSFKLVGKNKHDDAPDSLAMAADMIFGDGLAKIIVGKRII